MIQSIGFSPAAVTRTRISPGPLVDAVYRDQVVRLTTGARELLSQLPPAAAMRRWMDLFGDWIATKNGMLDTLLTMIESGEIAHAQTRTELLAAITTILDAGRAAGDLHSDVTASPHRHLHRGRCLSMSECESARSSGSLALR